MAESLSPFVARHIGPRDHESIQPELALSKQLAHELLAVHSFDQTPMPFFQ